MAEYKGDDDKSRENYIEYEKMKKTTKSPEYKNLLQQFMEMLQGPAKKPYKPNVSKRGSARKTAAASLRKKSQIPASPTN
jgi:hypothetical protein